MGGLHARPVTSLLKGLTGVRANPLRIRCFLSAADGAHAPAGDPAGSRPIFGWRTALRANMSETTPTLEFSVQQT